MMTTGLIAELLNGTVDWSARCAAVAVSPATTSVDPTIREVKTNEPRKSGPSDDALRENTNDIVDSLRDGNAGHFIENIAARTIPPYDPGVDVNRLRKRLVPLCIIGIDSFPWRQHEDRAMERVGSEHRFKLDRSQSRRLVEQA